MRPDQIVINKEYDFDKFEAYEIKKVETNPEGEKVYTLHSEPLVGVLRFINNLGKIHGVRYEWPAEESEMVQIIDGKPVAVLPTSKLFFVYKGR